MRDTSTDMSEDMRVRLYGLQTAMVWGDIKGRNSHDMPTNMTGLDKMT